MFYLQSESRKRGELGFGGTIPCAQTKGLDKFYSEGQHPEEMLLNGDYEKVPIFFGANKHEGSFVYGVAYNTYLSPNEVTNNETFLKYDLTETMLRMVGIDQGYAFSDQINEMYFETSQMGDLKSMTPGMIDVIPDTTCL